MGIKEGWTGRVFEDFTVGDVYQHPLGRTILPADNVWFTCLTMNTNPIHFDAEYAAKTEFGKPLVNSCLTLALVTGQSVTDLTVNAVANQFAVLTVGSELSTRKLSVTSPPLLLLLPRSPGLHALTSSAPIAMAKPAGSTPRTSPRRTPRAHRQPTPRNGRLRRSRPGP